MQRPVTTQSGSGTAAFTIARVEPGQMAEGRIRILTHRTEDTVWQTRWLDHPNGAVGFAALIVAVADLDEAARRFARFTGRPAVASSHGRSLRLDRGRVEFVTPDAFATLVPEVPIPSLPFMGAYGLIVRSLAHASAILREGGLDPRPIGSALAVRFPRSSAQAPGCSPSARRIFRGARNDPPLSSWTFGRWRGSAGCRGAAGC